MAKFDFVKLSHTQYEPEDGNGGDLAPFIFLHGLSINKETWAGVPQKLADLTKRKAYTYDARNHGDSEYTDDFSYEQNVHDLFYFMDTMDVEKAILVGHNMGGHIAIMAALQNPERVEMLFVEDMHVKDFPREFIEFGIPTMEFGMKILKMIPKEMNQEEAVKFYTDYMIDNTPADSMLHKFVNKEQMQKVKMLMKQNEEGEYIPSCNIDVVLKAMRNPEGIMPEVNGQYRGPAYFLYSEESPFQVHTHEEHIKEHFPNAEMIGFSGRIHVPHLDLEDEFVDAIYKCFGK